jgi:RNA polymerase-binding transcription factor DksA
VNNTEWEAFEREWAALSEEVLSGMADWRAQHPRASLSEIEGELDTRLAQMRARMLERVAQQSAATTWRQQASDQSDQEEAAPRCPQCVTRLEPRGRRRRRLRTSGGAQVHLQREYGVCPQCGQGLFPSGGKTGIKERRRPGSSGLRGR